MPLYKSVKHVKPEVEIVSDSPKEIFGKKNVIKVNRNLETNLEGVYAAGDCTGKPFQIAKSVGEGLVAALNAVSYLDKKVK